MGGHSTHFRRHQQGSRFDRNNLPVTFRSIENGTETSAPTKSCAARIGSALKNVKVCSSAALQLQDKLQEHYFTQWKENCEVQELNGYSVDQIDDLLHKVSTIFDINGINVYNKICGICFSQEIEVKIFEFTFGEQMNSGKMHFGMVAIAKSGSSLEAITCLYTLTFTIAKVLVQKKTQERIMGIKGKVHRREWWETKNLGFITTSDFTNFCRYKALTEFRERNLISSINNVDSISNI